ncbi:hypothetical Protein psc1_00340 [Candidatus Phytoplasma solani]
MEHLKQLKDEQKAHEETKVKLKEKSDELFEKEVELTNIELELEKQTNTYSGPLQTLALKTHHDAVKITKGIAKQVTSWFNWF